ncbi:MULTISPECIES: DUF362 domain-containing protein [unclassified Mesotoga]|jgi:uncharacterized protein (DUF362 family)/Pyruvate/2-oxoacid:ferredoxin oxidoreductase delta subunit|uniref:DUF362 domain-containing protein n=1 Tax=unclassified Mesotoga TaxID=1184398 RepID=UPI001BD3CEAC|nr:MULTISPECIES: DUF362 domain-containing protein [unclassified Mesotoga]
MENENLTKRVAVLSSPEYARCRKKISEGLDLIEFNETLQGKKVLLKVNLLSARSPENCVTTNPAFVRAVAEIFLERGAKVSIGDSPASVSTAVAAHASGIASVCEDLGVPLVDFDDPVPVVLEHGTYRSFEIARPVLETDLLVNLPKLKTHSLTQVTFGVKNLFGCVPGVKKQGWHFRVRNMKEFSVMLLDLAGYLKPSLTIIDGVEGMDGNGPSNGRIIRPGIIGISEDVFALDDAIAELFGVINSKVPILRLAREKGLVGNYKVVGDEVEPKKLSLPETNLIGVYGASLLRRLVTKFPKIDRKKCVSCRVCERACPAGAIDVSRFNIDYGKCIACYVCHELCPEDAIVFRRRIHR